jgi:hypothetical protein
MRSKTVESRIQNLVLKTAEQLRLKISWIKSNEDFEKAQSLGLSDLYCDIFAEAPYFEKFDREEIANYFQDIINENGLLFIGVQERKQKGDMLVAFNASVALAQKPPVLELLKGRIETDTASYFAEDAVIQERRRQGISRSMKKLLLASNFCDGFDNSFNQIAASLQLGARRIGDLSQDVMSLRLNGENKPDRRIFFNFDLGSKVLGMVNG